MFIGCVILFTANFSFAQDPDHITNLKKLLKQQTSLDSLFKFSYKLGVNYYKIQLDSSLQYFNKAYDYAKKNNSVTNVSKAINGVAIILTAQEKFKEAFKKYEEAIELAKEGENKVLIASLNYNYGELIMKTGDYKGALEYYEKAKGIYIEANKLKFTGDVFINIGVVYKNLGNYDVAFKNYFEAINYYERVDDDFSIAKVYNNIGNLKKRINEITEAKKYYFKSLKGFRKADNKFNIVGAITNIADIYMIESKYDSANVLLDSVIYNYKQHIPNRLIGLAYYKKGKVRIKQKMKVQALEDLTTALKLFTKIGIKDYVAETYLEIGNVHLSLKNFAKAESSLSRALELSKKLELKPTLKTIYEKLIELNALQANYKKAYQLSAVHSELKDSIMNEEKSKQIVEMETKYETEKKEKEIEIQKSEIIRKEQLNTFYLILVMVIGSGGFVIGLLYVIKRSAYKKLVEKNLKIARMDKGKRLKEDASDLNEKQKEIYEKLIDFVEKKEKFRNAELELTIYKLAEELRTNRTDLSKIIKIAAGKRYDEFINEYRINYAMKLLADESKDIYSISGIAEDSGFNSKTTFNRVFKTYTGITPSEFRKNRNI